MCVHQLQITEAAQQLEIGLDPDSKMKGGPAATIFDDQINVYRCGRVASQLTMAPSVARGSSQALPFYDKPQQCLCTWAALLVEPNNAHHRVC
mmetsp:Transcript_15004/g.26660  ORF Transcript_15004/g.26660 Transcript_15004/m.26660 type:complete len:93 (-) Transcript_15004:436-714(-)